MCLLIDNEAVVVELAIFYLRDCAVMPTFWGNENTVFFKLIFQVLYKIFKLSIELTYKACTSHNVQLVFSQTEHTC